MHLKDDLLRAMVDDELSGRLYDQTREHLSSCAACRARMQEIEVRAQRVRARMDAMTAHPAETPEIAPNKAYLRFNRRYRSAQPGKETFQTMFKRRPFWAALTVIVVVALALSLPTVQAWASDFLSLFRVQRVQVISFNPDNAEEARDLLESNEALIKEVLKDNLEVEKDGDLQVVDSIDEATEAAGFIPRLPVNKDDLQLAVRPGMQGVLTIDQPEFQTLIEAIELDLDLPDSLNGQTVTVTVPAAVIAADGCDIRESESEDELHRPAQVMSKDCTVLVQLPSPEIDSPEELDIQQVGEAFLKYAGLSEDEARSLSKRIDWTTTLVLPIPNSGDVKYREVQVDGVTGTLLQPVDEDYYTLVWVKDGRLYGLSGPGDMETALDKAAWIE